MKKILSIFLALFFCFSLATALPVTYSGDLTGATNTNVNIRFQTDLGNYSGLFNDTYVLNVVGDEGTLVQLFVDGTNIDNFTQYAMASIVDMDIFWPLLIDGETCSDADQCSSNCCDDEDATNDNQCGSCTFPTPPPGDPAGGSSGGGSMPPTTPTTTTVDVNETFDEEEQVEDAIPITDEEPTITEEVPAVEEESESWWTVQWNKIKSLFGPEWWKTVIAINILGIIFFWLLFLIYRRKNDEE